MQNNFFCFTKHLAFEFHSTPVNEVWIKMLTWPDCILRFELSIWRFVDSRANNCKKYIFLFEMFWCTFQTNIQLNGAILKRLFSSNLIFKFKAQKYPTLISLSLLSDYTKLKWNRDSSKKKKSYILWCRFGVAKLFDVITKPFS
jgi:hypothetical protein